MLTKEDLIRLHESLLMKYDSPEIDDFLSRGHRIQDVVMVHSLSSMKNTHQLLTKHGVLNIRYSRYMTESTAYLMVVPLGVQL